MKTPWLALPLFVFSYIITPSLAFAENRAGTIDAILLVDKSLSMAGTIEKVKRYAAGDIISALLVPGDRLIIEVFYGKVERLFAGTLRSEADKAEAIRSLNGIVADGHFTDIGAALDRASTDLSELGSPDRPKYVLLLTDERQEAPNGSPYIAKDYVLVHPALSYIKKVDLGAFRAITVGLDVAAKVDKAVPAIMTMLTEPPARSDKAFPPLAKDSPPGLETAAAPLSKTSEGQAAGGAPRVGAPGSGAESPAPPFLPPPALAVLLALLLAAIVIAALLLARKKKPSDEERHES